MDRDGHPDGEAEAEGMNICRPLKETIPSGESVRTHF